MSRGTGTNTPDRTISCEHSPNPSSSLLPKLAYRMCRTPDSKRVVMAWLMYEADDKAFSLAKGWEAPSMPLPRAYEIREMPENKQKGRGMFAVRDIAYGEYILRERPMILVPQLLEAEEDEAYGFMDKAVLQMLYWLEPADRALFLSMQNFKLQKEDGIPVLSGILRSNAMSIEIPQATACGPHIAVCRNLSFVNHSCSPNGLRTDDGESVTYVLQAARDIAAGEEITMPYTNLLRSRAQRQAALLQEYRFICSCDTCTVNSPESDKRRKFIDSTTRAYVETAEQWFAAPLTAQEKRNKVALSGREIKRFMAILDALNKEGLTDFRVETTQFLAWIYGTLCDKENFLKWGATSMKELKAWGGGSDNLMAQKSWEKWLRDPTTCRIWGIFV